MDANNFSGLSETTAAARLGEEGFNELPASKKRGLFIIALEVVREPMFLLLVACGGLYLVLGDLEEALMLLGFVFVVMGITLYQERKTERALDALRDLSSPRALVIRDGAEKRIAGREVVCGDILVVKEGDRIAADAELLACLNLSIDESLLTGESVPVQKCTLEDADGTARPGGDALPYIYSGTLVVQGQGVGRVRATGSGTEIGKIGTVLKTVAPEETRLQKEIRRLVGTVAMAGLALCAVVVVIYGWTRHDPGHGLLAGLTLAMAILPEEFPVVLTIFLALGAWRISEKRVLTRRIPAVETLGSATTLCVDKTGTLTLNRMAVRRLFADGQFRDVPLTDTGPFPEPLHELVEYGLLASQIDPFDPMEKAIKAFGELFLARTEHLHADWSLVHEYPLSGQLLSLSRVWRSPDRNDFIVAAKGAPEAIADLCHLPPGQFETLSGSIREMADDGLRVIGVARARFGRADLPEKQHDFRFRFLGLIGLADPVRPKVADAVDECRSAGIRVIMITGDYPETARNIARQIGLEETETVITGAELDRITDADLRQRIKTVHIFARVVPEQKMRLVQALKANNEIVAMTGDGVNDAPALKSAHIGIAMGGRGTDVAREAASLVLLNDDFSSIVDAVRMGRRIFDNIGKAMAYIIAVHVPIAGISLFPVLFGWPLVLMPVHIVFMELIIDPACSVVFENEPAEADVMHRPPRNPEERLFNRRRLALSLLQGASVLAILLAVFAISLHRGHGPNEARAMTFTTLIVANLCLILANRSWSQTIFGTLRSRNAALWIVLSGAVIFLAIILYVPFFRALFRFNRLHAVDLGICLAAGIFGIVWFEALKFFTGHRKPCMNGPREGIVRDK